MSEDNQSVWNKLFGSHYKDKEQQQRVREYIVHRIGKGVHLRDVLQEEYVQRNTSPAQIDDILQDPALLEATQTQLREYFSSESLAPTPPPSAAQKSGNERENLP